MRKIFLLLIVVAAVLVGSYFMKQDVKEEVSTKKIVELVAPANFNTYIDSKYGFQFIYPNNLVTTEYDKTPKPGGFKSFAVFKIPGNNSVMIKYSAGFGEGMGIDPSLVDCGVVKSVINGVEVERRTLCNSNSKLVTVSYKTEVPFTLWFDVNGKDNFSLEQTIFDEILKTVKLP